MQDVKTVVYSAWVWNRSWNQCEPKIFLAHHLCPVTWFVLEMLRFFATTILGLAHLPEENEHGLVQLERGRPWFNRDLSI